MAAIYSMSAENCQKLHDKVMELVRKVGEYKAGDVIKLPALRELGGIADELQEHLLHASGVDSDVWTPFVLESEDLARLSMQLMANPEVKANEMALRRAFVLCEKTARAGTTDFHYLLAMSMELQVVTTRLTMFQQGKQDGIALAAAGDKPWVASPGGDIGAKLT